MTDNPIDKAIFAELQESIGSDFASELVDTFLDEAPVMLAELGDAVATRAPDQFRRAAHSIKSNANIFGAHDLAELARQLEIGGLTDDPATDNASIAAMKVEYERAAAALKDLQDG